MSIRDLLSAQEITEKAKLLFQEERNKKRLDGWFLARESAFQSNAQEANAEQRAATELKAMITSIPLSISDYAIFAGTQSDAFAKTYALINPAFQVETFNGYCDPTSVFDDIIPNETLTKPRIDHLRARTRDTRYVQSLTQAYQEYDMYTEEVAFFFEQVCNTT